jgi:SAM-dependent methyltransferase
MPELADELVGSISPAAPPDADLPVYTLGSNPAERTRLRRQSEELHHHAAALIDRVALGPGQQVIDVGCGPTGILELLSERVGPRGRVIGLDMNPLHVEMARDFARDRGLRNVDIVEGDATDTGLPSEAFDVVHARLVLVNVPDPGAIVTELVRLTKPGGWMAGQEADCGAQLMYPPHPAWDRLSELFCTTYALDGADSEVGRRMPELYRAAGLVDVGVECHADAHTAQDSRHTILPDLVRSMRGKILERGLIGEDELDSLDATVRERLADPTTVTVPHLLFKAWGRKPEAEARR